jgi:hypothetical protein
MNKPAKVVLIVNLGTAKVLKRDMPLAILIRADDLVE